MSGYVPVWIVALKIKYLVLALQEAQRLVEEVDEQAGISSCDNDHGVESMEVRCLSQPADGQVMLL